MRAIEIARLAWFASPVLWKTALTRVVWALDRAIGLLRRRLRPDAGVLEPYVGYSTPDTVVARGRVLVTLRGRVARPGQGRLANVRQMVARFFTREVSGARVIANGTSAAAQADREGYFVLQIRRSPAQSGWIDVEAELAGRPETRVPLPVAVTSPTASVGVISDIDDTIMRTGAYSLALNLWTTLTGNSLTREVFADAVRLVARLHAGRNPVFYVSSSPWNLHDFLEQVFARAGLVRGPLFLRDLGIGRDQLVTRGHADHKATAIDTILAANPDLRFVLIGDTGQKDAQIYLDAARRHPGRVRRIILRRAKRRSPPGESDHAVAAAASGIPVSIGPTFGSLRPLRPEDASCPAVSRTG